MHVDIMPTSPMRFRCQGVAEAYAALEVLFPGARRLQVKSSKGDICRIEVEASDIAGVRVLSVKNTLPYRCIVTEPDDRLVLGFIERGGQTIERRGVEITESRPGRCTTGALRPGDAVNVSANCERRIICVPARRVNDVIARHFHVAPPRTVELVPAVTAGAPRDALYQLARHALVGAETADESPFGSIVAKQYSDLLISSILLGFPNTFSGELGKASGAATNRYVKRALDFMRANVDQPIDVDEIARNAACSPRRLQSAFRAHFGLTPMAFLNEERLRLAERRLRAGECEDVTSLAYSLGFSNPGRFAGQFRQRFGVLPSEILCSNLSAPASDAPATEPRRARDLEVAAK
ncbi:MAG TPA: AraC family transcriptional regulator [Roseiarcus sp.]|nr:AraC family transcriptional regulator [Roseiarcus sp.]